MKKKVVFVGISGGVDSAVSAALLKEQGYEVVGVFIQTWHPNFLSCNEEEERRDAMRVAAHLDIPFLTFDFKDIYKKEVADYMIREYKAGRTPNPDVMCNKYVKFGAFLKKAVSMGADYVATGHYACIKHASKKYKVSKVYKEKIVYKYYELLIGCDSTKDQSYFLWTLKQEQLKKILFPIGHLKKSKVRKLARKFNLPVAEKKDSQGICFLGEIDLKEFLKHYIKSKKGRVFNKKKEKIGYHSGVFLYTLGERHGFTITKKSPNDKAYYVTAKDIKNNILIVSQNRNKNLLQPHSQHSFQKDFHLYLKNINWISKVPEQNKNYTAQIRYHGEFLTCEIKIIGKTKTEVIFKKFILVDSGQSCVFYDKNICLGGGIVI